MGRFTEGCYMEGLRKDGVGLSTDDLHVPTHKIFQKRCRHWAGGQPWALGPHLQEALGGPRGNPGPRESLGSPGGPNPNGTKYELKNYKFNDYNWKPIVGTRSSCKVLFLHFPLKTRPLQLDPTAGVPFFVA